MRLTLRTLLAYLDDTLEPLEIKAIGQKIGESETAQELIARIKQVTRRRRLTTPPATGPNSFDPNMVSDYLDNELSNEQIAELEKICLESDVHLAEVAACHQILTLVLGEPAHVPPTAKERMYALVQGREAIPFRRAATADGKVSVPSDADADADEMFLLGLPFYRRGSWLRWALPLAAVLLFTVVGVALWQTIQGIDQSATKKRVVENRNTKPNPADNSDHPVVKEPGKVPAKDANNPSGAPPKPSEKGTAAGTKPADSPKSPGKTSDENSPTETKKPETETPGNNNSPPPDPNKTPLLSSVGRDAPPLKDRVEVGRYHTDTVGPSSLLVGRKGDKDDWMRVKPGANVFTNDHLMSFPGYASEVWLDNGLHLLLRGHVREFTPQLLAKDPGTGEVRNEAGIMDHLHESAIVLHKPNHTDADVTLQRGRLYLSNHSTKQPGTLVMRLRFENKVWDVLLHPGTEIVLDLFKARFAGQPITRLDFFLLSGNAGLVVEHDNYPLLSVPGTAHFVWNSTQPSKYLPGQVNQQDLEQATRVLFAKRPTINSPEASGMERALTTVKKMMGLDESPLVALREVLEKPGLEKPYEHRLAIYCLGAMDEIKELLNILNRGDLINSPDRMFAIVALRRWLDRGPEQSKKLFDPESGKGLLIDCMFTRDEAERIMVLLRDPTYDKVYSKTYYEEAARDLASERVALAELASWRLKALAIGFFKLNMPQLKQFNSAVPSAARRVAMQEVLDQINEGLLPPPLENGKSGPGGAGVNPGSRPNR